MKENEKNGEILIQTQSFLTTTRKWNKYENYKMTDFSESNQDSDRIFEMDL